MSEQLTERQRKWFASVRAGLAAKTGKPIEEWVAIARTCPHDKPRARADWLREQHGIGVNHAAFILGEAFPQAGGWDDAATLRAALWKDAGVLEAVERIAAGVPGLVRGQRKAFTAFSRDVQFAALRPLKSGGALLALKLPPDASPRLSHSTRKESWSERLTATVELPDAASVEAEIERLFLAASKNG